ncbi:MAG: pyridoxal phosphate-dependent aminotransferase [Coraliomargaritaceae bacterium]
MHNLSVWAKGVSPSPTLAVDAKAKALKAAGESVCGFGAGEPDFDTPEFIKVAAEKALKDGMTKYAPAAGVPALRSAIAEKYARDNGLGDTEASQVIVSPGGKFSCYLAILSVVSPEDEVIIPAPYWVSYPEMVKLAGGVPKYITTEMEDGFKINAEQFKAAITDKTRMVILNSPSNPTGAIYTKSELEAIVAVAIEHNIYILSDEIYEYLLYDGVKHYSPASFSKEAENLTITVSGFSKTFSMTGWRLGTLVAPLEIAKAVGSLQSQTSSNATTFAQYGALAALQEWDQSLSAVKGMLKHFDRRRIMLLDGLNAIPGIECNRSEGAFYLFPRIKNLGISSIEFADQLLEEKKVAVVPGEAFGAPGYMRLSYATSDEVITEGLKRLNEFCTNFKG